MDQLFQEIWILYHLPVFITCILNPGDSFNRLILDQTFFDFIVLNKYELSVREYQGRTSIEWTNFKLSTKDLYKTINLIMDSILLVMNDFEELNHIQALSDIKGINIVNIDSTINKLDQEAVNFIQKYIQSNKSPKVYQKHLDELINNIKDKSVQKNVYNVFQLGKFQMIMEQRLQRLTNMLSTGLKVHDNGGRPFEVIIHPKTIELMVKSDGEYKKLFTIDKYEKVWVGEDECDKNFSKGNSILIQLTKNKYMFVGMEVITFTLKNKIVKYFSPIGNNDVPYPWFIDDKNNVYMLSDPRRIEFFHVNDSLLKTFGNCTSSSLCDRSKCKKNDPYNQSVKTSVLASKVVQPRI
jgi:hypothetical protein